MKDKLVKTGHKKAYYKVRSFGIFVCSFLAFAVAAIAPIYITKTIVEVRKAEEETSLVSSIEEIAESTSDILESGF